jgi:prepilin-type processing-associated H-X9-DG protein
MHDVSRIGATHRKLNAAPARHASASAFTLAELLVVIGVISILISILLPALGKARDTAATIKCAANLRSIGQGLAAYAAENYGYLPVSYNYRGSTVDTATNTQTPAANNFGFIHWTGLIYGNTPPDAFQCPAMTNGGLPATDPFPGNFDADQTTDAADAGGPLPQGAEGTAQPVSSAQAASSPYYADAQAARLAYTLNEALCGRNKYVLGFQGCTRTYRNVSLNEIGNSAGTILATEFVDDWGIVSGVARSGTPAVCLSHRPVQPFRQDGTGSGDQACDVSAVAGSAALRRTNAADLWRLSGPNPRTGSTRSLDLVADYRAGRYDPSSRASRLDWVGRNHSRGEFPADNKSNFLYCDGHVETKSILQTVPADAAHQVPWEWGEKPYAISPNTTNP